MDDENMSEPENVLNSEADEEINPNDSDDGKRFDNNSDEAGFIGSFCKLEGNDFFVELDPEFIEKRSNLFGVACNFKNYEELLSFILSEDVIDESNNRIIQEYISDIKELYGQIHARFIKTQKGMALVREKYLNGVYGVCPRILCNKQTVLPIGLSNETKYARVKIFCPRCNEIYDAKYKQSQMDGAYFGLSFPQEFFMNYPDLEPFTNNNLNPDFVPKLHGFKIYGKKGSKYYKKA